MGEDTWKLDFIYELNLGNTDNSAVPFKLTGQLIIYIDFSLVFFKSIISGFLGVYGFARSPEKGPCFAKANF